MLHGGGGVIVSGRGRVVTPRGGRLAEERLSLVAAREAGKEIGREE